MDFNAVLQKIIDFLSLYGLRIIGAIIIFVVGKWLAKVLSKVVERVVEKNTEGKTLSTFARNLSYVALVAFVIVAAINQLGVQTASFIAVLGAAGLAIGLALQGSLSNFASGVMLVFFQYFHVGDYIDAGGEKGDVQEVGIFSTKLKTRDNKLVIIPNSNIIGGPIINYTAEPIRRVDLVFGIGYDDDLLKAKRVLEEILKADERVLEKPEYTVAVSEHGASSVNFVVRPFVKTEDYWNVYFDLHEKVKLRFDEEDISIPYPQRDIHIFNEDTE
jgi:small conductance mechanosensitive channel